MQPYVPFDNVLIAASSLAGSMAYAAIAQVNASESSLKVYAGRRVPSIAYESLEDYRKFRLSSRPVPVPQNFAAWRCSTSFNLNLEKPNIMSNPITIQSSPGLSDILGAYDHGHWETVTAQLKPASGVLLRGSVLSAVTADGGKLTLTAGGRRRPPTASFSTRASTLPPPIPAAPSLLP